MRMRSPPIKPQLERQSSRSKSRRKPLPLWPFAIVLFLCVFLLLHRGSIAPMKTIAEWHTIDGSLAIVEQCSQLFYSSGSDESQDRPAFLRATSGLSWNKYGQLVVVQDDVNFVGIIDLDVTSEAFEVIQVKSLSLPKINGKRQFDTLRGNKRLKMDFETILRVPSLDILIAFGSGSPSRSGNVLDRDKVMILKDHTRHLQDFIDPACIRLFGVTRLYDLFRNTKDFSGSQLNIEGAVLIRYEDTQFIRFFQRGNGKSIGGIQAISSTCDVSLDEFLSYILADDSLEAHFDSQNLHRQGIKYSEAKGALPHIINIVQFDLGALEGVPLTFTDATLSANGQVAYLAGGEDSPNAFDDGVVTGSVLGIMDCNPRCFAKHTVLSNPDGTVFQGKAEGLAFHPDNPNRIFIVIDSDDAQRPAELCSVSVKFCDV